MIGWMVNTRRKWLFGPNKSSIKKADISLYQVNLNPLLRGSKFHLQHRINSCMFRATQ